MTNQVYSNNGFDAGEMSLEEPPAYHQEIDLEKNQTKTEKEPISAAAVDQDLADKQIAHAGMNKEEVLRFSNTLKWNRARTVSILVCWIALLALAITVLVLTIVTPRCDAAPSITWWQTAVFYQVYPRSFYDSDSDGVGDIKGITMKLDNLQKLGVNGLLLGSIFQSQTTGTLSDFGYEITDHLALDPQLADLQDFQELIAAAHDRNIAIIVDFVPNFTGSDHPWFVQSSQSVNYNNEFWNAYVWNDNPQVPNNWLNVYTNGSSWELSTVKSQFYFSNFLSTQPELNLRSSHVKDLMENVLSYWLGIGVDGFRIVQSEYLVESLDLQNETSIPCLNSENLYSCITHTQTTNQPESFDLFVRWRSLLKNFSDDRVLITNARVDASARVKYYGTGALNGIQLPATFLFDRLDEANLNGWNASKFIADWLNQKPSGATNMWMTSDEDSSRLRSQYGADLVESLLVLRLTLPGASILYYGEEIGMVDTSPTPVHDPASQYGMGRDGYRVPYSWTNDSTNAGFSNSTTPWLSITSNENPYNLESQLNDPKSFYSLVQRLLQLRKDEGSLKIGTYLPVSVNNENILAFIREYEGFDRLLIAMNIGGNISSTVNLRSSSIYIPYRATVLLTTSSLVALKVADEVDLENCALYLKGDAFVASWPYARP